MTDYEKKSLEYQAAIKNSIRVIEYIIAISALASLVGFFLSF